MAGRAVLTGLFFANDCRLYQRPAGRPDTAGRSPSARPIVGTDAKFPPMEYCDDTTNDLVGFEIALIPEIARHERLDLEIKNLPKAKLPAALDDKVWALAIAAWPKRPELSAKYQVTDRYVSAGLVLVVPDKSALNSIEELGSGSVGTLVGGAGPAELKAGGLAAGRLFESADKLFAAPAAQTCSAVLIEAPMALGHVLLSQDFTAQFRIVGQAPSNLPLGMVLAKDNQNLYRIVQRALDRLRTGGGLKVLKQRWNFFAV